MYVLSRAPSPTLAPARRDGWATSATGRFVATVATRRTGSAKRLIVVKKWFFEIILLFYAWFFAAGDLPVPRGVLWAQLHTVPNILALPGIKGK